MSDFLIFTFVWHLHQKYHTVKTPFLLTMSSTTDHFDNDFSTASNKIPRYSAQLARQMDDRFIALYDFHRMFVHGVFKLSFGHKFLCDQWLPYVSINMISTHSRCKRGDFHVVYYVTGPRLSLMFFFSQSKKSAFLSNLSMSLQKRNLH